MGLSKRLALVASFANEGGSLIDIGTDRGYIPIVLMRQGKVTEAIVMDVRKGSLERAREHIREYYPEGHTEMRLSDGAEWLKVGEADTVAIAGMSGELVVHILEGGRHLRDEVGQRVPSPQSELDKVGTYLQEGRFVITRKDMVEEDGKYYTVMGVPHDVMEEMSQTERLYGTYLIRHKNPVLREFSKRERDQLLKIREQLNTQSTDSARARLAELTRELGWNGETQDEMQ